MLLLTNVQPINRWRALFGYGLPGVWTQFFLFEHGLRDHSNCLLAPVSCGIAQSLGAKLNSQGDAKFSLMAPGALVHPHCGPTNGRLRIHLGLLVSPEDSKKMGMYVGNHNRRHVSNINGGGFEEEEDKHVGGNAEDFEDEFDIIDHQPRPSLKDNNYNKNNKEREIEDVGTNNENDVSNQIELLRWEEGKAFCFDDSFEHSVFHNGTHPRLVFILDILHPDMQNDDSDSDDSDDDGISKNKKAASSEQYKFPLPEIGPPVSVLKNNILAYPEQAARLGLKPPPTTWKAFLLESEKLHTSLFVLSLFVLLYFYWRLALSPQINKLRNVMEERRKKKAKLLKEEEEEDKKNN
jgi:hypothetical protein